MAASDTAAVLSSAAALATAGATLWLTVLTRTAARASERAAEVSGHQLQEAHRPVLVPGAAEGLRPPGDHATPKVTLHNIGAGPALRVRATLQVTRSRNADERDGPAPTRKVTAEQVLSGVAAGGAASVTFPRDAIEAGSGLVYSIELSFDDVAGHHYAAKASFDRGRAVFGRIEVAERPRLKLERIPPPRPWWQPWRRDR